MTTPTAKLGFPDWRQAELYPKCDELTDRQWWWEFTRRRPDYRNLWRTHLELHEVENDTLVATDYQKLRLEFEMSRLLDPGKSFSDWDLICHRYPRNRGHADRYDHLNTLGIKAMLEDPDTAPWVDELIVEKKRQAELEKEAGVYSFTFNLKTPLKPQLQRAEEHLRMIQDAQYGRLKRTSEKSNWPTYLRVLDARDSHPPASWRTIGNTIWPGDVGNLERARKHHAAAEGVRDRFPRLPSSNKR